MRRSELRRMGHDEADAVRSARPEGVKDAAMRIGLVFVIMWQQLL